MADTLALRGRMKLITTRGVIGIAVIVLWVPSTTAAQAIPEEFEALPQTIPIFPLQDVTLFPNSTQPFHIFESRYRDMVADALESDSIIGMVLLQPGYESEYEGRPPVYGMGCAGVIIASEELPDGRYNIVLGGLTKFQILSEESDQTYRIAHVEAVSDGVPTSEHSLLPQSREELEEVFRTAFPNAQLSSSDMSDAEVIDGLSLVAPIEPTERQGLLEADGPVQRASELASLLRQRFRIAP